MKRLNTIVNQNATMQPDSRAQQVPGGHEWPEAVTLTMCGPDCGLRFALCPWAQQDLLASRDTFETPLRTLGYAFHGAEGHFPASAVRVTSSPAHHVSRPTETVSNSTFTDAMLIACHWPWWEHLHHGNR